MVDAWPMLHGWADGWVDESVQWWMLCYGCGGWMAGWMQLWIDEWVDEWMRWSMAGWMGGWLGAMRWLMAGWSVAAMLWRLR